LTKMKERKPGVYLSKAVAVIFATLFPLFAGCSKLPVEHQVVEATAGEIRIPVSEVNDGKVHFYTYRKSGKRINFFVRTDGAGRLSTYFDACFTCYKHKKGYRCEGTDLICNECNEKFRLADERWENNKGCSPIALTSSIGKDFIIIKTGDIEAGERLF
jgi:uncharacterized membrane protein